MSDQYSFLASLVTGGVAGAAVNAVVTHRKQKIDITISVAKDYFSFYSEIAEAYANLRVETPLNNEQINNVRKVGNFLSYLVKLQASQYINNHIFRKIGAERAIDIFRSDVTAAMQKHPELESAWLWWPDLQHFKMKDI